MPIKKRYEYIGPLSRSQSKANLNSNDPELIARTLIAIGMYEKDWKWVQKQCLRFFCDPRELVVCAAILGLAHMARVNRKIDRDKVIPALKALASNQNYQSKIQDAMDDIETFATPTPTKKQRKERG